jgi:O-acetyl-ADP-ribose deacetylase (regulator of RNase III)
MIELVQGNLLEADVEAQVNAINCRGVMVKGIALQFKLAFPEMFKAYQKACKAGEVQPGKLFIVPVGQLSNPKFIVNFPTKRHWMEPSRLEDIKSGLVALTDDVQKLGITSIAVPRLGCGAGGLDWQDVKPLIEDAFADVPSVKVLLFGA